MQSQQSIPFFQGFRYDYITTAKHIANVAQKNIRLHQQSTSLFIYCLLYHYSKFIAYTFLFNICISRIVQNLIKYSLNSLQQRQTLLKDFSIILKVEFSIVYFKLDEITYQQSFLLSILDCFYRDLWSRLILSLNFSLVGLIIHFIGCGDIHIMLFRLNRGFYLRRVMFDRFSRGSNCLHSRRFLPKPHETCLIQLLLIIFKSHQTFNCFFVKFVYVRRDSSKPYVLPDLFIFFQKGIMNNFLDILGVFRVHPKVDFFMREYHWHPIVDMSKLGSSIFGKYDNFIVICVQTSYQEMISFFRAQAKGLFLLVPFEVTFHNHNASIFDDIDEHSLIQKFLNPSIDDHVVFSMCTPFHVSQLPTVLILYILIFEFLLPLFLNIKSVHFYDGNICCRADIVRTRMKLTVCAFFGTSYLHQPKQRQRLKNPPTHVYLF